MSCVHHGPFWMTQRVPWLLSFSPGSSCLCVQQLESNGCQTERWYLIYCSCAQPWQPAASNPALPRGPLFGVVFSVCLLRPFQRRAPQRCPPAEFCSEELSPDIKSGDRRRRQGSRELTDLRIYAVVSWDLRLSSTC